MPLTRPLQRTVTLLATHRNPESYVAGGAVLQVKASAARRTSTSSTTGSAARTAARADSAALAADGLRAAWERQDPAIYRAEVADAVEATRLDWVIDSDYRFFPTLPDPLFGYVLHPLDLATNKMLAAADGSSLATPSICCGSTPLQPLGAVAWAAAEKDPGWMPEGLLAEVRAKARYHDYLLETRT